jgi:hypothetical protein
MCCEIDARTRDNPESAMVHTAAPQQPGFESWNWPMSEDAQRWVDSHKPTHERNFDSEAHRRFIRSLG